MQNRLRTYSKVKGDFWFIAIDDDGHRFNHALAQGTEVCFQCKAKLSPLQDMMIVAQFPERMYCYDCIRFQIYEKQAPDDKLMTRE